MRVTHNVPVGVNAKYFSSISNLKVTEFHMFSV
jgi:hypothetical protein